MENKKCAQYIFIMQFLKYYMKIRNFSLVLLITIFYRQLQDHMGIVFCTMPEIPSKEKKIIQSFCFSLEFVGCQLMVYVDCRMNRLLGIILLFKHVQLLGKI